MSAPKLRIEGYVAHALSRNAAHAIAVDAANEEGRPYVVVPAQSGGWYVLCAEHVVLPQPNDLTPLLAASLSKLKPPVKVREREEGDL